jgi:transcriptional regulator with GAF, ATPase, and Fis domain
VESELFGIESRAASGVDFREGKIKLADGGTVFLNEIGELSLSVQAKILRVIEERLLDRVGGKSPVGVDVRFICATNRDLRAMVEEGTFRSDLYYRISVFETIIPPLRERTEDIPLLAQHILIAKCRKYGRSPMRLPKTTAAQLVSQPGKGNIRELANLIERGIILADNDELILDGSTPGSGISIIPQDAANGRKSLPEIVSEFERQYILNALRSTGWKMGLSASQLGIPVSTLRSKMGKLDITKPKQIR